MTKVYYNEFDPNAAAWLRELAREGLIPDGEIDTRSICDVQPSDLVGFTQCHFFAGIGGWPYALQLADWGDRPVWTGSCPCQPFSAAGKRKGVEDERHLWPAFFRLIKACRPEVVFGEQVASSEVVGTQQEAAFIVAVQAGDYAKANKLARRVSQAKGFHYPARWVDGIRSDLEAEGYAFWISVPGAHSVGSQNIRQRLYWVANAELQRAGQGDGQERAAEQRRNRPSIDGDAVRLEHPTGDGQDEGWTESGGRCDSGGREPGGMADTSSFGYPRGEDGRIGGAVGGGMLVPEPGVPTLGMGNANAEQRTQRNVRAEAGVEASQWADARGSNPWSSFSLITCRDGKTRRVPAGFESPLQCMADGLPDDLGLVRRAGFPLCEAFTGRNSLLKGLGNSIVPQVAAEFIKAYMEATCPA